MDRLLTVNEVAEMFQCHPKTVYRNQRLPAVDIPGVGIRFKRSELEKLIDENASLKPSLLARVEPPKTFILRDLREYDRLYLKSKKGGIRGSMRGQKTRWNYGIGSVSVRKTKLGSERWYVDFLANGRRCREVVKNAQNRADAILHLQSKVSECFSQSHGSAGKKRAVDFAELAERYLEDYAKVMKRSFKSDLYTAKAHLIPFFGKSKLDQISCLQLEKYRAERLKAGMKKTSINRELAILSRIFSLGIDWGFASENPVKKIRFFSEQDSAKERILTQEEESRLLEASPIYLRLILKVALNTGMRRGEILSLMWGQVDLQKRVIRVERTKSGKNRYVPLNTDLAKILADLHRQRGNAESVFENADTGSPFKDLKRAFKSACKRANISDLRFHDLRHTFASRLIEKGADLITVKELLGHSTVKMTERYTHPNNSQKQNAVELLAQSGLPSPFATARLSNIRQMGAKVLPRHKPTASISIS